MKLTFIGANSSTEVVVKSFNSYFISIPPRVAGSGTLFVDLNLESGRLRMAVENEEAAEQLRKDIHSAIESSTDTEFKVVNIGL